MEIIKEAELEVSELKYGDIVEFDESIAILVKSYDENDSYPILIFDLKKNKIANQHGSFKTLLEHGCGALGAVKKVYTESQLTLGGTINVAKFY